MPEREREALAHRAATAHQAVQDAERERSRVFAEVNRLGLSCRAISVATGVPPMTVHRWMRGAGRRV